MARSRISPILITVLLTLVGTSASLVSKRGPNDVQQSDDVFNRAAFGHLQNKARAAKSNQPVEVGAMVDAVFDGNMVVGGAPQSIRDRVARAELSLRHGASRGVRTDDLVKALNNAVVNFKLPGYFRTSKNQLRSFRQDHRYILRDFVRPGLGSKEEEDWISPTEAIFVGADMVLQKYLVEENRISPEEWDARRRQREQDFKEADKTLKHLEQQRPRLMASVSLDTPIVIPDFSSETAVATVELHRILDELGIPR